MGRGIHSVPIYQGGARLRPEGYGGLALRWFPATPLAWPNRDRISQYWPHRGRSKPQIEPVPPMGRSFPDIGSCRKPFHVSSRFKGSSTLSPGRFSSFYRSWHDPCKGEATAHMKWPLPHAQRRLLLCLCLPFLVDPPGMAQVTNATNATNVTNAQRSLSLAESIRISVEHNFDVKIELKGVALERHRLGLAYSDYDPVLRSGIVHSKDLSPGGIDDQNRTFSGTETERDNVLGSVDGVLPTGLRYELGGDFVDSHGTSPTDGPFENTSGTVAIRLAQPLLRNLWIDERRLNIQVSKKRLKISELAWRGQLMETVT